MERILQEFDKFTTWIYNTTKGKYGLISLIYIWLAIIQGLFFLLRGLL
jgi:hypothetical protein